MVVGGKASGFASALRCLVSSDLGDSLLISPADSAVDVAMTGTLLW